MNAELESGAEVSPGRIWGKSVPSTMYSKCKGPVAGESWGCSRNRKKAQDAGSTVSKGRGWEMGQKRWVGKSQVVQALGQHRPQLCSHVVRTDLSKPCHSFPMQLNLMIALGERLL